MGVVDGNQPMPTDLKRDLGLVDTAAIAIGAMIGSGIFILPGIAYVFAGPAAVLAFAVAAVLVLPAALAVAEMATAIPEDGSPICTSSGAWVRCLAPSPGRGRGSCSR